MMKEKNEERNIAIQITGVKKKYRLGQIGGGTLQEDLQSWWARKRGREDPNSPIGLDRQRLVGKTFMALDGIDLTVRQGEALGIIGSNGAGKSTLLKLISRITAPTEGEIDICGRVSSMLEVGTGFNAQMTGRENVYMNGAILGMTRAEIDAKLEDIIEFSEVRDFIDTPVKRYSSGMFVKLAFAVAAHLNSEILIMDEVLAVGDAAFQKKCLEKMRDAATLQGRTVLYVSHNMNTIRELCTRCVVLDQGKLIFDGDVDEAIALYLRRMSGESETSIDLSKKNHTLAADLGLAMEHLELAEKTLPVYGRDEELVLKLKVRVTQPLDRLLFRLTIRTDTDQALGTSWSKPFDLPQTGTHELTCRLPLSIIKKGVLSCSIGVYRESEAGMRLIIDHITRAFRIEVREKRGSDTWTTTAHGYLELQSTDITVN